MRRQKSSALIPVREGTRRRAQFQVGVAPNLGTYERPSIPKSGPGAVLLVVTQEHKIPQTTVDEPLVPACILETLEAIQTRRHTEPREAEHLPLHQGALFHRREHGVDFPPKMSGERLKITVYPHPDRVHETNQRRGGQERLRGGLQNL
jgi:hypothetical protein